MKRFHIGTLMLLVVIAALGTALVVRERQAARREVDLRLSAASREAELKAKITEMEQDDYARWKKLAERRAQYPRSTPPPTARFPLGPLPPD